MKVLNIGSVNIDRVYSVDRFVRGKETILAPVLEEFCGGKGLNQSLALARAGAEVYHAGAIGHDGDFLAEEMRAAGVDLTYLQRREDTVTGHAVIQLTPKGENCIIVYPGANAMLDEDYLAETISHFGPGDILLQQNETSGVGFAMRRAKEQGMKIAFNPSPINEAMMDYPLDLVDFFLINEVEGRALSGTDFTDYHFILNALSTRWPSASIILTAGGDGVFYSGPEGEFSHGIYSVPVVDSTAAGDTFSGYYLATTMRGCSVEQALDYASRAAAIAVSRKGAGPSIPNWEEVEALGTGS